VVVLGLGNPGAEYAKTRHNLGAEAVAGLARRLGVKMGRGGLRTRKLQSLWGRGNIQDRKVILALPQTYMNLSGQAAAALTAYFGISPRSVLVVHDDLDLELGRLKIARKGSAAGHKGVNSLIQNLGTDMFLRLRLGIGRPQYKESVEKYVLSGFYSDQRDLAENMVEKAVDCMETILTQGEDTAMQKFHQNVIREVDG
jgi:PTH1 family peptidyl-tRNA hydrolase